MTKKNHSKQSQKEQKISPSRKLADIVQTPVKAVACSINPESPVASASAKLAKPKQHRKNHKYAAMMDTSDLQSQDSTSFEVQSARGASDTTMDTMPSLSSELEGIPKII